MGQPQNQKQHHPEIIGQHSDVNEFGELTSIRLQVAIQVRLVGLHGLCQRVIARQKSRGSGGIRAENALTCNALERFCQ